MRISNIRYVAVAALAAFTFAACSSSSKSPAADTTPSTTAPAAVTTTTAGSSSSTPTAGATTVSIITDPKLGKIMVDSKGLVLYVDENDKPGKPACTAGCLSVWPPVPAPASPTFGPGLKASMFSTVTASDGTKQLAVNGSPLYTFVGKPAGDSSGQDVNGFYTVMPNGVKYDPGASAG